MWELRLDGDHREKQQDGDSKTYERATELRLNYQPPGSGQCEKPCSRLSDIALSVCSGVGNFGSELRKIWEQVRAIDKSVTLPEAFVVQKSLYGLGGEINDFRTSFNLYYTVVPMSVAGEIQDAVTLNKTIGAAGEFKARNLKSEGSKVFLARTIGSTALLPLCHM